MAHKLRSVNTRFWDDPFITELNPSEKLLFLYLLTNPMTNIIGIYEVTLKRICFDTGLTKETISKGLERFETLSKAFYSESFIILPNFLKNQKLNANMKVAAIKEFSALPEWLKDRILSNGSKGLGNGYQTILNGLAMIRQVEGEVEVEIENAKIGGGLSSRRSAMKRLENFTEEELDAELEKISAESIQSGVVNPNNPPQF